MNNHVAYKRMELNIVLDKDLNNIFPVQIRRAFLKKGLFEKDIAHNHAENGDNITRDPAFLFRKTSKNTLSIIAVGDDAIAYMREIQLPIGKDVSITDKSGNKKLFLIESAKYSIALDRIEINGFHNYKTATPLAMKQKGRGLANRINEAETHEGKMELVANYISGSIRRKIAQFSSCDVEDVPPVHVVADGEIMGIHVKDKRADIAFKGKFSCNCLMSGLNKGVGLGRHTAMGYGVIRGDR